MGDLAWVSVISFDEPSAYIHTRFASEFDFLERGEDYLNLQHTLEMGIR
jgi:hypothetical protein